MSSHVPTFKVHVFTNVNFKLDKFRKKTLYYTNNECLCVQLYKYFHEVKDEMFHSTRRSEVEWKISSFTV